MITKKERLKDRGLFQLVFNKKLKKAQKISSSLMLLYYMQLKNINTFPKVAFIAPVNIDKRSTKRNLFKRRMKAAYISLKEKFKHLQNTGLIMIWIAKPEIKQAGFQEIKLQMQHLISKIKDTVMIQKFIK